ncbi:MAG: NYN domain-containing protein [Peptococcaceae bacterium]|nr:NYN domain-containing protein [Peptococcaceae bacterium]
MDRIANFIDGGYLDKVLKLEFNLAPIDYSLLANWMANGIDILRTYYYNCLPYKNNPPSPEQAKRFSRKQSFFYSLQRMPKFDVREGKLEFRGIDRDTGNPIFQQKRVDILLGVDLALLASKNKITHAGILTSDSDFLPAIIAAKQEGVIIKLYHSTFKDQIRNIDLCPHKDLWDAADERIPITQSVIDSILRR